MRFAPRPSGVKQFLLLPVVVSLCATASTSHAQDLVITGVVDGPLSGGVPKAVELCALADIPDLSIYGVGSANNGGGTDGQEFTFPAVAVTAGSFIYVASEASGFSTFFGFAPDYTSSAMAINGDDAIELFMSSTVVDVFGDIDVDGSGQPWEYMDGWAYRADRTGPDGNFFAIGHWSFSGPNALDGESSNATAAMPFPIGTQSCERGETTAPPPDILLSEIVVTPTGGEFVEIHNPTAVSVDLSDVYLTDATFAGGGTYYYNIVTGDDAGGGGFSDFHARFPDGASIAAGEFQTIALAGSDDFFAEYGLDPTYELYEDGASADVIADMREALPGSINNQGGLTNSGEVVVLYTWDGESDLVGDIDYALWGDTAEAVDKTGVGIDGPDADGELSFYAPDTALASQEIILPDAHPFGDSFQRTDFSEGVETQVGGNGLTGSDETSEDLSVTWSALAPTPGAAPPPPAPSGDWIINELLADPASGDAGDANGDGIRDGSADEFVEIINASGGDVDISGWTLADGFTVRHTFPAGTVVAEGCAIVVFGGPAPTGAFGLAEVQTASTGFLGLNNSGDTVTLSNGSSDVTSVSYGSEGGNNQSLTRDPDGDAVAAFVQHSNASTSGGALFSPGTNADGSQFAGCPSTWVINEINADPDSSLGDANGDGTPHFSDDEFVEIVNRTGSDVDVSGWTIADGFRVRHTFPAGSVIYDGCSAVIFGGGMPTGGFGNSLVQAASGGNLGLNNGGDTVTLNNGVSDVVAATYGSEGGDNQSLTLDPDVTGTPPYVRHASAPGSGATLFSPGTKLDGAQFDGCPVTAAVTDVQGSGDASPFVGQRVVTVGVVTALAPDGFFIQVPDDGNPDTSNGIFVYTGEPPTVAVGDEVEVTGTVDEFFGMTEITGSLVINVIGPGVVPAPIVFDGDRPSPDPSAPSCAIEYECYEGMLVEIPNGIVAASNQRFNPDPIAEVHVTAGPNRPFREPGVEYPGLTGEPLIPVWDGNPEIFELDPDKMGLPNQIIPAGSTFSAVGVIGFEFGGYELWPTELDVTPAPIPVPVRAREANEGTIGSLNLFRLFDDIDDAPDGDRNDFVVPTDVYNLRLAKFATYVVDLMRSPDILAVQEVESLKVLHDLASAIAAQDPGTSYTAHLVEGNDVGTIDVGFLVRNSVTVGAVTQLGKDELLTFDGSLLHDRPPLLLEGTMNDAFPVAVMVLHMRSLGGIDGSEGDRVRQKRYEQAVSVANKVQAIQTANPGVNLVVIGDFNAFEFTDGYVDLAGIVMGEIDPDQSLVCDTNSCADIVAPNLSSEVLNIHPDERYSFVFSGNAQILDHAMTSSAVAPLVTGLEFARGNADAAVDLINDEGDSYDLAVRSSDHDGLVLFIFRDEDRDGVGDDLDVCRGTVLPEGAASKGLGVNRFADVDGDGVFDTTPPKGKGPQRAYDIHDTAGCSCEQIVEEEGLGKGHLKHGCSIGVMDNWVRRVGY